MGFDFPSHEGVRSSTLWWSLACFPDQRRHPPSVPPPCASRSVPTIWLAALRVAVVVVGDIKQNFLYFLFSGTWVMKLWSFFTWGSRMCEGKLGGLSVCFGVLGFDWRVHRMVVNTTNGAIQTLISSSDYISLFRYRTITVSSVNHGSL